jgi:RecA-family ATPase
MALATGGSVLGFRAPKALPILYVDGEMHPSDVQARLKAFAKAFEVDGNGGPIENRIHILSHWDQEDDLHIDDPRRKGMEEIEEALVETQAEVLFLDNISTLCREGGENDADAWTEMQAWMGRLNKNEVTTCVLHHTGKADRETGKIDQRGSSKHFDKATSYVLLGPMEKKGFYLKWRKQRMGQEPVDLSAKIEWPEDECRLVMRLSEAKKKEIMGYMA